MTENNRTQIRKERRIVLVGNPNSGKTSIFNALTGSRQNVGNYPGVTVEKKEGHYKLDGVDFTVLDLPGTYSLTCYSPEERITRKEIMNPPPDVTVVVVDSTNLERNLYLLVQVMEMGANSVLCLNMSDEARKAGQRLNVDQMERLLGFPVVETIGHKRIGIDALREAIARAADERADPSGRLVLGDRLERSIALLEPIVSRARWRSLFKPYPRYVAVKLLEGDLEAIAWIQDNCDDHEVVLKAAQDEAENLANDSGMHPGLYIADARYGFAAGLLRETRLNVMRGDARVISDKLDSVLCHKTLGLPFFFLAMYVIFWLTFSVGSYPMGWLEAGFEALGEGVNSLWPPGSGSAIRSLLVDGVIGGVGGVIVFLPNIMLLFLGLAFLEDTGYMARAAFLMDNLLHRFGLHGKSFIPMITGFGCTVPGIMATRTLENERDRLTTMLILPLMSCGARLPIYMLLIPAFFPDRMRAPMLWLIYLIGIVLAAGLARLLRSTILSGEDTPFVMELPPYRLPTLKAVLEKMWERGWVYVRKAGTIILTISILLWALSSFPAKESYDVDDRVTAGADLSDEEIEAARLSEDLRHSITGRIGTTIEPLLSPMGFDWRIGTALLGSFAAKEVFVSQMGIIMSLGETTESSTSLQDRLRGSYSSLQAFCLMLFLLIATPCMATVAVTRRESGRWKWAILQFGGLTLLAYALTVIVYQVGLFFV
jgi:ferrous iron transport protein B